MPPSVTTQERTQEEDPRKGEAGVKWGHNWQQENQPVFENKDGKCLLVFKLIIFGRVAYVLCAHSTILADYYSNHQRKRESH